MFGFKAYRTVTATLAGIELAHCIGKRPFTLGPDCWNSWSVKKQWDRGLTGTPGVLEPCEMGLGPLMHPIFCRTQLFDGL